MKTYRCVIIDDEPLAHELLSSYIQQLPYLKLVGAYTQAMDALPVFKEDIDLVFLDIKMPDIQGLEFAGLLQDKVSIIFTTAYSQYAVQSYEKNALDYLLKPISFDRFLVAVNKLINRKPSINAEVKTEKDYIFVKANSQYIRLAYSSIGFIEALKDYVIFHRGEDRFVVYHSLKKLEPILPSSFIRVHYSYIANFDCVQRYKDYHLLIFNQKIPVSRKYREIVQNQIDAYLI